MFGFSFFLLTFFVQIFTLLFIFHFSFMEESLLGKLNKNNSPFIFLEKSFAFNDSSAINFNNVKKWKVAVLL